MKLLIATPAFNGQVHTDYVGSLLNSLKYCATQGISAEVYFLKGSSSIGYARNNCAAQALRLGVDKLLFIDADQAWTEEDFALLMQSKRTLVGGTYMKKQFPWRLNFNPTDEHYKICTMEHDPRNPEHFAQYAAMADAETGEIEVKHLPTGFMLIDCEILRKLQEVTPTYLSKEDAESEELRYWDFFPSGVNGGAYETEDWFFCSEARALGHPPYLNTRVIIDHYGSLNYRIPKHLRPVRK